MTSPTATAAATAATAATTATTTTRKRVFLGGLVQTVSLDDIEERFKSFGVVSNSKLALNEEGECRGFAHFDLETSEAQWKRLISAYNGSSWRGSKLCIDEAQPDYTVRYLNRDATNVDKEKVETTKRKRPLIRHRGDMSLMTDALVGKRKGWKRARYGRAIAMMRLRRPDGRMMTIDPAHYKESVTKLFGSVRPLPISKLSWSIQEDVPSQARPVADDLVDSNSEDESSDSQPEEVKVTTKNDVEIKEAVDTKPLEPAQEGFFLSKLLGLDPITVVESASRAKQNIPEEEQEKDAERTPSSFDITKLDLKTLLFEPSEFETIPLDDYAFSRRCGFDEFIMLWKESRSFLREQFKKQIKDANRKYKSKLVRK